MQALDHFSAAAIAYGFATDAQAARLAGLSESRIEPRSAPTPLRDEALSVRLTRSLSRLRDWVRQDAFTPPPVPNHQS